MWRLELIALLLAAAAVPAMGQVTTCSGSNVALSLGAYNSFQGTPLDASGIFTVSCTRSGGSPTATANVGIGPSFNSGTIATRQMKLTTGADLLSYNLYRDIGRAQVWGDTIGTNTVVQSITLANNTSGTLTFTIFSRIDALQDVRAGFYTDNLTVTVSF